MGEETAGGQEINIRSRAFYRPFLLCSAMGAVGALLTLAFVLVLRNGTQLIW